MMGTRVALASTHHPQTNGLTERCNRTLIAMIRKFTQTHPYCWAEMIPLFEFAYNQSRHATTRMSPFEAVYGEQPPTPVELLFPEKRAAAGETNDYVRKKRQQLVDIGQFMKQQERQQAAKTAARENEKRGRPQFAPGDEVLVYWPPFSAYSDTVRKQRMRYHGPFPVSEVISNSVVQLEGLPSKMPKHINVEYVHLYRRDNEQWKKEMRKENAAASPMKGGSSSRRGRL